MKVAWIEDAQRMNLRERGNDDKSEAERLNYPLFPKIANLQGVRGKLREKY
jgi:hypothetical protein